MRSIAKFFCLWSACSHAGVVHELHEGIMHCYALMVTQSIQFLQTFGTLHLHG